ncbi:polyphosphate polymerase domain-containing protein [Flavobacteriaceae bacterium]|nr:polyphosphate polymerase domain-containing protein [Flavobacteriaceae bacterium]
MGKVANNKKIKKPSYRYERKFHIKNLTKDEVISFINLDSSIFRFAFKTRVINNIYFDNIYFKNYYENVEGDTDRIKVRVRWYGELFKDLKKPKLEIKIKKGFLGYKESMSIEKFDLTKDLSNIFFQIKDTYLYNYYNLKNLNPVLMNSYTRSYYISNDNNYRITIDDNQSYYKISKNNNNFNKKFIDYNSIVLELKYNDQNDDDVSLITQNFPFRMTKNSKYVNGIESVYEI